MPESGKKPDNQQIADCVKTSFSVSAKGNVDVITKPASQSNMPSAPEFRHGQRKIGMGKVVRQRKAHQLSQPFGHQGIAVKVKVNLEAEGDNSHPCQGRGNAFKANGLDLAPKPSYLICQKNLKSKSQSEFPQSFFKICKTAGAAVKLLPDGIVGDNRTGNKLGEHGDVHSIINKGGLVGGVLPVNVCQIGNCLKGIKADSNRKRQTADREKGFQSKVCQQNIQIFCKKAGIFKQEQPEQVEDNACCQPFFPVLFFSAPSKENSNPVIDPDGQNQKKKVQGLILDSIKIEDQAARKQTEIFPSVGTNIIKQ